MMTAAEALARIKPDANIEDLKELARSVPAAAVGPGAIFYSGLGQPTKRVLDAVKRATGYVIIDDTERGALLQSNEFKLAIARAAGIKEADPRAALIKLEKGRDEGATLPDSDPDKAAAVRANTLLFGKAGDAPALQNSFWGEASKEFAESASGDSLLLLGAPVEKVFWGVELPALQSVAARSYPGPVVNGMPAAAIPKGMGAAFNTMKPSGLALANALIESPAGADVGAVIKQTLASFVPPARSGTSTAVRMAARILDPVIHPLPGMLQPGPGSFNVMIGGKPAWRGVPAAAAAAIQAAKAASDATIQVAEAATLAAAGTPGAPAAKAAEEATKAAAAASMGSMISGAAGGADIHICATPLPIPPHGPGVVVDGSQTVLINGLSASRVGDTIIEAVGPPNKIVMGMPTVMIGG